VKITICALAVAVTVLAACSSSKEDVLHIYNWNNYIAPETLDRFKQECKCQVVYDTYGDNEELLAKLAGGAKGYDILVPTGNAMDALIKQGALLPIDKSKLPNLKYILPKYLDTEFDPGNKYSVPYAYSVTLIGFNEQKIKQLGIPTATWAAVFDPVQLEQVRGKVTVLDSPNELFGAALKYLGYSVNDLDESHWARARDVIVKAKPYWAAFNNTSYIRELSVGNIWLTHGYSNDMYQANTDAQKSGRNFTIASAVPMEGAVFALDNMVIHKSAPRPDLAHQFMNFMLEPKSAAELVNMTGSGTPNSAALQYVKPEILANKGIFPDKELLTKLEMLKDLDRDKRRVRSQMWTEIKLK
jgi:spermidine/putrescine transport system substrate-binding protein